MNTSPKRIQLTSGNATWCALKPPVAPPNLAWKPPNGAWPRRSATSSANCPRRRSQNTPISLPRRVGVAGWPCVRASRGTSCHSRAMRSSGASTLVRRQGRRMSCRAPLSMRGRAVLLTSCEVRPKWMNSFVLATCAALSASPFLLKSAARASKRPFSQYSTAFTSWLVTFSCAFTATPSSWLNSSYIRRSSGKRSCGNACSGASGGRAFVHNAMKYSTSTFTRCLIKLSSEQYGRRACVRAT
mmetsp:Transcript_45752/g.115163  ORF Transcript_45752/g.115163 Transcript_45752/m.115163 type:complete len:243 (+) Transcript_45752:843-1571(+)